MTSIRIDDDTDNSGDFLELEAAGEKDFPCYVYLRIENPIDNDFCSINIPIKALREALDKIEAEA